MKENIEIWDYITEEELKQFPGLIDFVEICGRDATIEIMKKYSGGAVYFPKVNSFSKACTEYAKAKRKAGSSDYCIAKELNLTVRTIQKNIRASVQKKLSDIDNLNRN